MTLPPFSFQSSKFVLDGDGQEHRCIRNIHPPRGVPQSKGSGVPADWDGHGADSGTASGEPWLTVTIGWRLSKIWLGVGCWIRIAAGYKYKSEVFWRIKLWLSHWHLSLIHSSQSISRRCGLGYTRVVSTPELLVLVVSQEAMINQVPWEARTWFRRRCWLFRWYSVWQWCCSW